MTRALQQQLLALVETAAAVLDLPLTRNHIDRLAVELTPGVAAMFAGDDSAAAELESGSYAFTGSDDSAERHVREFAGCTLSIRADVAEDAPAALLGLELQRTQSDVLALDVPSAKALIVTVKPRSPVAWDWWLSKFEATTCSPEQPCCATTAGRYGDIAVELRGEGVPDLLASKGDFMAGHPW